MIQRCNGPGFPYEAIVRPGSCCHVRGQDLDRDRPIEPRVMRFINLAHTAGPEARPELVGTEASTFKACTDALDRCQRRLRAKEAIRTLVRRQQQLDLFAEVVIVATRRPDVRRPQLRRQCHRTFEHSTHARPFFGTRWHQRPALSRDSRDYPNANLTLVLNAHQNASNSAGISRQLSLATFSRRRSWRRCRKPKPRGS